MFELPLRKLLKIQAGILLKRLPFLFNQISKGVNVFLYHDVTDHPSEFVSKFNLFVSKSVFAQQIRWVRENFNVIGMDQLFQSVKIPENAAIITFDDGFRGAFANGFSILAEQNTPATMFLNMDSIQNRRPLISALLIFLEENDAEFRDYMRQKNISSPAYLNASPSQFAEFGATLSDETTKKALAFQGPLADSDILKYWSNNKLITYGDHLFEHWNCASLSVDEITQQALKSQSELSRYDNYLPVFAFPNGQPGRCFNWQNISTLLSLKNRKLFFSYGGGNCKTEKLIYDRLYFGPLDSSYNALYTGYALRKLINRGRPKYCFGKNWDKSHT